MRCSQRRWSVGERHCRAHVVLSSTELNTQAGDGDNAIAKKLGSSSVYRLIGQ